ncbi:hypothetical protein DUNSADRAFT_76 [Dunaliella salina]|uniref:GATA-type domain-containing protein n=1 Tax=Dunaliella salina TaxID=3046 RepID=A0ABQ7H8U2_DUNSA|nr:hypothetical protein DUNSADRAFT_76 [Dunaliella salina]|eukprot:KAF5843274.1 hypothetical protein DUNSADRAFT_76 [Dunaliella salina]
MIPPSEAAGPALSHYPELSSSSNSESSMCTAFELGRTHSKGASQVSAPPTVTHLTVKVEEPQPTRSSVPKDMGYVAIGAQVQKQQQQQEKVLPMPVAGAGFAHPTPTHTNPPSSWPPEAMAQPAPSAPHVGTRPAPLTIDAGSLAARLAMDAGSPKHESSTAVAIPCVPAPSMERSMEPTPVEGGGRISPDFSSCEKPAVEQQQQLLLQPTKVPASQVAAAADAVSAAQGTNNTRHTKRTPVPSVRLQRMLEGDAPVPPKRQQQPKKKQQGGSSASGVVGGFATLGSKRGADEPHEHALLLQHQNGGGSSSFGGVDARRTKPRLQLGSSKACGGGGGSSTASVAAAGAGFALNQGMFAWPDEQEEVMSGGSQHPDALDVGRGSGGPSFLCEEPFFVGPEGGPTGLMPMGLTSAGDLPVSALNAPSAAAMWAPSGFGTQGEDTGIDLQLPTDLLEVAAELAAAADKEGEGHGIHGSSAIRSTNQRQHLHSMMVSSSTHARLQGLGNRPRPVPHCNTARVVAPQPPQQPQRCLTPEDYDGHIDSENGLPQVPPPRLPAGQPRGAPRPPARVLVPHPTGGCCTACKVNATPVWRTGPHGPKTLCNACGVRYTKVVRRK